MKIGFAANLYGTPKGHSYVVKDMLSALKVAGHETHMFRMGNNPITPEFPLPDTMREKDERIITKEEFESWLDETQPDWCVFMEYMQWWDEDHDKLQICKDRGIKTAGFLVWEKLDWKKKEHYKLYTKIICPTGFQTKLCRKNGLYNSVHVPWGVDFTEIDALDSPQREDGKLIFYHCAGSGGVGNRKNTDAIIKAYNMIKDDTTELIMTHLYSKTFGRNEILSFMKYADVLINTARWDTIGLNTIEANACGIPAIVCDAEPMNELVKDRINGFVVPGEKTTCEYVTCPAIDVSVEELAKKMRILKSKIILDTLKKNSRKFAEVNFDWKKNQEELLKLFV